VNCKPFACVFLIGSAVFAADLSGRYQGLASGKKADGTGPERKLFVILRLENNAVYCSAGLDSFERQKKKKKKKRNRRKKQKKRRKS